MAHQAHNLPWQTLASNFKFVYSNHRYHNRTNLYPCFKPGQGKQLQHFAKVFSSTLSSYSTQERKKYTPSSEIKHLEHGEPSELFISEELAARISRTMKWPKDRQTPYYPDRYSDPTDEKRRASFWMNELNEIDFPWGDESLNVVLEMMKTLLQYGDMEPLLRLMASAGNVTRVWTFPEEDGGGLAEIKDSFLTAYICLNVLYLKPEIWDPISRRNKVSEMCRPGEAISASLEPENWDYRLTSSYQWMLINTVTSRNLEEERVGTLPHREFFGTEKDTYSMGLRWLRDEKGDKFGQGPLSELMNERRSNRYISSPEDVPEVLDVLGKKGLPAELALNILDMAEYGKAKRRLVVADDPLHSKNSEELKKYLSYCWRVLARLDMLVKENSCWIDWEHEVTETIFKLWGVPYPKMSNVVPAWKLEEANRYLEVDEHRNLRTFI